jgi:hypothetical protein
VLDPERREGVIVEPDPAGKPAVSIVLLTQPVERPGAADAFERRVQPQRHEDCRIDRWPSRMALDCLDARIQRREIEPLHEGPHEASPMVGAEEAVEIDRTQLELAPVR